MLLYLTLVTSYILGPFLCFPPNVHDNLFDISSCIRLVFTNKTALSLIKRVAIVCPNLLERNGIESQPQSPIL